MRRTFRHHAPAAAALSAVLVLAILAAIVACGGGGFDPQSKVDSVRLFVVKADKPYAQPGETVNLEALLTDARRERPRAAKLYWIPILCLNPQDDLYFLCFANPGDASNQAGATRLIPLGSFAGADAGGNPFAAIPTGVDLGPFLPQGPTFSFRVPDDAVKARPQSPQRPYGLAVIFNVLCAGSLQFRPRAPAGGAQQVPVVCADENGIALAASDYVIGITRVYSFPDRVNTNPVLEKVTFEGNDVDLAKGITLEKCTAEKEKDCKENKIDVRVSDSSWEANPADVTRDGELREQIWVDYYSDIGTFDDEARLLFDTRVGRVSESEVKFRAPKGVADGTMWAVVHDNRGGAAWFVVPLHVR